MYPDVIRAYARKTNANLGMSTAILSRLLGFRGLGLGAEGGDSYGDFDFWPGALLFLEYPVLELDTGAGEGEIAIYGTIQNVQKYYCCRISYYLILSHIYNR